MSTIMCTKAKGVDCKNPSVSEPNLIEELTVLLDTLDIDEIGMRGKIEAEITRYNKFRMGSATERELDGIRNLMRRAVNRTPVAKLLRTIPGVGTVVSLVIAAEVGDFNRFASPDKLCSFAGLVPSSYSSGESVRHGTVFVSGQKAVLMIRARRPHRNTMTIQAE